MDALLPIFIAVLLAETGGRVQCRSHDLQRRFNAAGAILGALALTTLASFMVGGLGGAILSGMISFEARSLMVGLALILAGVPMLLRPKPLRDLAGNAAFATSVKAFVRLQFGDASQFLVFALAARSAQPALSIGAGLAAVLVVAGVPLLLGRDWPGRLRLGLLRRVAALLLIAAGCRMVVVALELI